MWKNYLTIAYRTLKRNKGYAFINVAGLAVGMAACLLIGLYVRHELSYDRFHEKAERIYRVDEITERSPDGSPYLDVEVGPTLEASIPEVREAVRISPGPELVKHAGEVVGEVQSLYTEPGFFDVFSFELLAGAPDEMLRRPNTAVITQPLAKKIFGGESPLGKMITIEVRGQLVTIEIAGVAARVPSNSHFTFDLLISLETLRSAIGNRSFHAMELWTYVLLSEDARSRKLAPTLQQVAEEFAYYGPDYYFELHPLLEIYLHYWAPRQGDPRYVYIFGAIAVVILLIACVNYMNLATARSTQRAREVGVRKTAGATRRQLMRQFLGESLVMSLLALPLALGLLRLALPAFNALADTDITLGLFGNASAMLGLVGLAAIVGLLAGSYPALVLSRFAPTQILRDRLPTGWSGVRLRKALIVFQFALSAAILFSTAIIVRQLYFVQHKNLGFDEEQIVAIPLQSRKLAQQAETIKQEFLRHPHVLQATLSLGLPGLRGFGGGASIFPWKNKEIELHHVSIDPDFIETLNIHLLAGRSFSPRRPADSSAYVLNEAAVQALRWVSPEAAVGKTLNYFKGEWRIIGIVENFHFQSLHHEIAPLSMQLGSLYSTVTVRIEAGHIAGTLDNLRQTWQEFTPNMPFDYIFLDDKIDQLYRQERRTAKIVGAFAGLAVFLACLGLFGLVTYAVERRAKEIGIRKVLGASVPSIVALLSKDFLKLVLVAFVIAAPVAYFAMSGWLQDFAYRIELGPWVFVGVGMLALVIALFTVSYQAVKAALANPVEALRDE